MIYASSNVFTICIASLAQDPVGVTSKRRRNCRASESPERHAGVPLPRKGTCAEAVCRKW